MIDSNLMDNKQLTLKAYLNLSSILLKNFYLNEVCRFHCKIRFVLFEKKKNSNLAKQNF